MIRDVLLLSLVAASMFAAACATVDSTSDRAASASHVADRLGMQPRWERSTGPDPAVPSTPLSEEEAVRLALERNPTLRGTLTEIDLARARLAEADTPPNPIVSLWIGVPLEGGGASAVTAAAMQQLAWLWRHPNDVDAAEARLRAAILDGAHAAVALATEVRVAYGTVALRQAQETSLRSAVAARVAAVTALEASVAIGQRPATDLAAARGDAAEATRELADAEAEAAAAEVRLAALLGDASGTVRQPDGVGESLVLGLADRSGLAPPLGAVARRRLDVAAAVARVVAAEAELRAAGDRRIPAIDLGVEYERMMGEPDALGPSLAVELPLFDRGDARVASALARLEAARAAARATGQAALREVRIAATTSTARFAAWREGSEVLASAAATEAHRARERLATGSGSALEASLAEAVAAKRASDAWMGALAAFEAACRLELVCGGSLDPELPSLAEATEVVRGR
jgi:cobalt-zinc-cadmium efflux system outer membrane protein